MEKAGIYFIPDFGKYKELSKALDQYRDNFDEKFRAVSLSTAEKLRKDLRSLPDPVTKENKEFRPLFLEEANAIVLKFGKSLLSESRYFDAARVFAAAMLRPGNLAFEFKRSLDQTVALAAEKKGPLEAERICRRTTFSGLSIFPEKSEKYVREAFEELKDKSKYEEAFEMALYWSTSCLNSFSGVSIAGYVPYITREETEEAFAKWKGL